MKSILLACVSSVVLCSFTDWYFFGMLFHDHYVTSPGVWKKYRDQADEMRSIYIGQAFISVSSVVFVLACAREGWT